MINPTIVITDPDSGEERLVSYSDLESDVQERLFARPMGGFIFPANSFILRKLPEAPFYVKDWLPKHGKSMMYAPAKSGKSYLAIQLGRCVARGEDFVGIPTRKGKVLYVQFELGEEILQDRLRSTGKDYNDMFVGTSFSLKLDTAPGQAQLERAMSAVEPDVLLIDPLYKTLAGDENESSDARRTIDYLDRLIESYNCSIFITHHSGKDPSKRGRGSSVYEDWVDSYLQVQKSSKRGERLKIKVTPIFLRHAQEPPQPLELTLGEDFEFHTLTPTETVKEQVGEFVEEWGKEITPAEIFSAEIGSNTSVYEALKELVEEGKVEKTGRGKYKWRDQMQE